MERSDTTQDGINDTDSDEECNSKTALHTTSKCDLNTDEQWSQILLNKEIIHKSMPVQIYSNKTSEEVVTLKSEHHDRHNHQRHFYNNHRHNDRHHHHHHHHHHNHQVYSMSNCANENGCSTEEQNINEDGFEQSVTEAMNDVDINNLMPIIAGQTEADLHVPIMSPPPFEDTYSSNYIRSNCNQKRKIMSYKFVTAGETVICGFEKDQYNTDVQNLLALSEIASSRTHCACSSTKHNDCSFRGWQAPQKTLQFRGGQRRRSSIRPTVFEQSFARLNQAMGKCPVIFQHYQDISSFIERYRFYHTVGNTGRPQLIISAMINNADKYAENDYYNNTKSNICSMTNSGDLYSLLTSPPKEINLGSASSHEKNPVHVESDDESNEDSIKDLKPYTIRDRGKTLNLAPVRECMVPSLRPSEKIDLMQLNQYLNLTTRPVSKTCIQFQVDEESVKWFGDLVANKADNNLFPACSPRRGARPLRLGSAEFVVPGSAESKAKWSTEKRQRAASYTTNAVIGNLIVGSTVSPVPSAKVRAKSGSEKKISHAHSQKELQKSQQKPPTPPQHVSGRKFKCCERFSEMSSATQSGRFREMSSATQRGRFNYTHAANVDKVTVLTRTASMFDINGNYTSGNNVKVSLEVNHLGIRGHTFKQGEPIVVYKNRRTAAIKS